MSSNSTASSNVSLPALYSFFVDCTTVRANSFVFVAYTTADVILILPLSIIIFHVGIQRRRRQGSAAQSHCDFITYHMVAMEMSCALVSVLYSAGFLIGHPQLMIISAHLFLITACGQTSFHTLTCVECYLAVVRPIFYMSLRNASCIRIRNIIIWCVWLLCLAEIGTLFFNNIGVIILVYFMQQVFSLAVISFCSLSVVRALKRPGPGDGGGGRDRVDKSKQRAFNTIMTIMGALTLRLVGCLVCTAVYLSPQISSSGRCMVIDLNVWLGLPSSLVSPLLFLYRAGKLSCCRSNTESGQGSS